MSILQRIKAEVSALDIARKEGIEVISKGSTDKCICPFHKEVTPSLAFYEGGFRWKCFGCHASGDAIDLYQRLHGLEGKFKQALEEVARIYLGVEIEKDDPSKPFDHRALWPYDKPEARVYTFPEGDYVKYGPGPSDKVTIIHVSDPPSIRFGCSKDQYYLSRGAWRRIKKGNTPPDLAPRREFEEVKFSLYRPEVWKGIDKNEWIYLCEGPSDADAAIRIGLPATTPTAGSSGFQERHAEELRDRRVIILTDNDSSGREGQRKRGELLEGIAREIRYLPALGKKDGYDLRDWIEEREGKEIEREEIKKEFLELVEREAKNSLPSGGDGGSKGKKKQQSSGSGNIAEERRFTDVGNADRLAEEYEGRLIHCEGTDTGWYVWNCCRYKAATKHEEIDLARKRIDKILDEELGKADSDEEREKIKEFGKSSLSSRAINAMLSIGKGDQRIAVDPSEFDADPFEVNTPQGVLDLRSGELVSHEEYTAKTGKPLRFMKAIGCNYDPEATREEWEKFLRSIIVDEDGEVDEETIAFLKRVCGYLLTGSVKEKCLFILWGDGDNGKGFFVSALTKVLADYCREIDFRALLQMRSEQEANPYVASLAGLRAAWAAEAPESSKWNEGVLKRVVGGGGDRLTARYLHGNPIQFDLSAKIILQTNHRPMAYDRSSGFWGRIRLVKLRRRFVKDWDKHDPLTAAPDPTILERLHGEASGILNWMIEGCMEWQRDGLGISKAVDEEVRKYRIEEDPTADFVGDKLFLELGSSISSKRLIGLYYEYCEEEKIKPLSVQRLSKCIQSLQGVTKGRIGAGGKEGNGYFGIREKGTWELEFEAMGNGEGREDRENGERENGEGKGFKVSDQPPF